MNGHTQNPLRAAVFAPHLPKLDSVAMLTHGGDFRKPAASLFFARISPPQNVHLSIVDKAGQYRLRLSTNRLLFKPNGDVGEQIKISKNNALMVSAGTILDPVPCT